LPSHYLKLEVGKNCEVVKKIEIGIISELAILAEISSKLATSLAFSIS
tara:strand:- start:15647 stop:15790 length:144 start_codon:yes stop_codon:yes gene_type:complete